MFLGGLGIASGAQARKWATTTTTLLNPCSGIRGVWRCAVRGGTCMPLPGLAAALKAGVRKPTRTPGKPALQFKGSCCVHAMSSKAVGTPKFTMH